MTPRRPPPASADRRGHGYLAFAVISAVLMLVAAGVLTAVVRGSARRAGAAPSAPHGAEAAEAGVEAAAPPSGRVFPRRLA
jgi:hypothetical protein